VVRKNNAGGGRRGIYTRERSKKLHINATELKDARYLLDLKRKLDLYWNYPISAARRGEQGKLRATFKVKRDGTIYEIKLVKSSGYPTLDDAVITALRLCSPLNPLPETFEKEELDVRANFEYVLTRM
jgi:protein TonB